jgi:hypothetical protein
MATVTTTIVSGTFITVPGVMLNRAVQCITGLSAGASNTVAHGLPHAPQVVGLNCWGPAGNSLCVLDSTQGYVDAGGNHLGYDSTNIYIVTSATTTTAQATYEYGRV